MKTIFQNYACLKKKELKGGKEKKEKRRKGRSEKGRKRERKGERDKGRNREKEKENWNFPTEVSETQESQSLIFQWCGRMSKLNGPRCS